MKKVMLLIMGMFFAVNANAAIFSNGSFETGNFNSWSDDPTTGSTAVVTSSTASLSGSGNVYTATEGNYFAELTADSSISQSIAWSAGETMTFDWAFLAFDYSPYIDSAFFSLFDGTTLLKALTLADVSTVGDYGDTGWNTFSYSFVNAGSGLISFGVANLLDNSVDSKLLVDNLTPTNPVPVPAALLLFAPALLGFLGLRRKAAVAV